VLPTSTSLLFRSKTVGRNFISTAGCSFSLLPPKAFQPFEDDKFVPEISNILDGNEINGHCLTRISGNALAGN
jgi:hypothetical protein